MENTRNLNRIWEIDFFRGISVIGMIVLHILYDLEAFYNIPIGYSTGIIDFIRCIDALLFITLSGISTMFSRSSLKRGILVLVVALVLTLVTYLFNHDYFVIFGILHFMGTCMILSIILKRIRSRWLIILSAILAISQWILPYINVSHNYLFAFGIHNNNFSSSDYYPLLPWAWAFVFGMVLGRFVYKEKKSVFKFTIMNNPISFAGKHSLVIYIIHQPIVLVLLHLIFNIF